MDLLALIMGAILSGGTIIEYGKQPLDYKEIEQVSIQEEQPILEGYASRYDYKLGNVRRSKTHSTCALRIYERYENYKVCTEKKCITCYHNDYGPARQDRVIDLSSKAFKDLGEPLSKGVVKVKVFISE